MEDVTPLLQEQSRHGAEPLPRDTSRVAKGNAEDQTPVLRAPRPPLDELLVTSADATAIGRAHREHAYSMRQIASHLGCGVTTVHRRIRSWEEDNKPGV